MKWPKPSHINLGGGFTYSLFSPHIWGRWTHFDEHIFQMGRNHQLGELFMELYLDVQQEVIVTIRDRKLVDFTYLRDVNNLLRGYNPVIKYHGHPSTVDGRNPANHLCIKPYWDVQDFWTINSRASRTAQKVDPVKKKTKFWTKNRRVGKKPVFRLWVLYAWNTGLVWFKSDDFFCGFSRKLNKKNVFFWTKHLQILGFGRL